MAVINRLGPYPVANRRITGKREGAMLVFVAVAMVVLLGFLAMTLDVGAGNRQRRIAQTAADAGALGGGAEIFRLQYDSVVSSARNEAVRNGFPADDVTVNRPPASGPHAGDSMYVEVIINKTIPTIFGGIFNFASLNIAARGVAGVGSYSLTCLYSLDPSGAKAVELKGGGGGGNGDLTTNCGIAVNSTDPNGLELNNSGEIRSTGGGIAVSGGWDGSKPPTPYPQTGVAPVVNPLASVPSPSIGACTSLGPVTISKDTVLNPGVYCGGIKITNKTTTLNPGTYIIAGGGLSVQGATLNGFGVTLINSIDSTGTYGWGPIDFGNGCKTNLSAPVDPSNPYNGIVMYGDPRGPTGALNTFACASDTDPELRGILYFPTQQILFDGSNAGTQIVGAVIAYQVAISGKVEIRLDTSGSTVLKRLSLVE